MGKCACFVRIYSRGSECAIDCNAEGSFDPSPTENYWRSIKAFRVLEFMFIFASIKIALISGLILAGSYFLLTRRKSLEPIARYSILSILLGVSFLGAESISSLVVHSGSGRILQWAGSLAGIGMISLGCAGLVRNVLTSRAPLARHPGAPGHPEEPGRINEDWLKMMAASLPVMLSYFDREQRWQFTTGRAREWMNRDPEELLGKTIAEVAKPETYAKIVPYIERVLAGEPQQYEGEFSYPDGILRRFQATYIPNIAADGQVVGFTSMVVDITERKLAEEELKASQLLLQAVFDSSPIGIFVRDREGRTLMAN